MNTYKLMICDQCKSPNIHITAWIDVNRDQITTDDPPHDDGWCLTCEDECDLEEIWVQAENIESAILIAEEESEGETNDSSS